MNSCGSERAGLSRGSRLVFVVLLAAGSGGCGPRLPAGKVRVTGTVTYQSQPLAADAICFAPLNKAALRAGGMAHPDELHFFCGACIKSYGSSLNRPRLSGQVQEFVNDVVIPARDLYTKPMFTKKK